MLAVMKNHSLIKYGSIFNELCQPLMRNTPINYIGLARIYTDNSRSYLITDPTWGEVLLKNNYHLAGTEDALAKHTRSSHELWSASSMFSLNESTQQLFTDCVANNYGNGITLIERGSAFVEFIHICADSGHESVDPYLEHNIDQLWKRVVCLRELITESDELRKAYSQRYYYQLNTLDQPNENIIFMSNPDQPKRYDLGGSFDGIKFTQKELSCMIMLFSNLTAKDQARILDLSYRSVEAMIDRIKSKCNIKSKTELIIKLSQNSAFQSFSFHMPFRCND